MSFLAASGAVLWIVNNLSSFRPVTPEPPSVAPAAARRRIPVPAPSDLAIGALMQARSQIGVKESPPGSNSGPEVDQYLASIGLRSGIPWNQAFVYWCWQQASTKIGRSNPLPGTGSVLGLWNKAETAGFDRLMMSEAVADRSRIVPGAIFVMDFGGGRGHSGIVEQVDSGVITTIEGNASANFERTGGGVHRLTRKMAEVNKGYLVHIAQ